MKWSFQAGIDASPNLVAAFLFLEGDFALVMPLSSTEID